MFEGVKKARVKQKPVKTVESVTTEKEHVNIVFIGHVDAGKSTIGGQLMYLTNMVDKRWVLIGQFSIMTCNACF